jgi:hypothetical protein
MPLRRLPVPRIRGRMRVSGGVLDAQTLNVILWLVQNVFLFDTKCKWLSTPVLFLGAFQWTCINTIFLTGLINASNLNPWMEHGKSRFLGGLASCPLQNSLTGCNG